MISATSSNSEISASQQLVRFEALFGLLDEIHHLDDIELIAQKSAQQWKFIANLCAWRLVLIRQDSYLIIENKNSQIKIEEIAVLPDWDTYYLGLFKPCLITNLQQMESGPLLPEHLLHKAAVEILVLPFIRQNECFALLSTTARQVAFDPMDKKFIYLLGRHLAEHLDNILLRKEAFERLQNLASHDVLTGALNRAAIMQRLQTLFALALRTKTSVSVVMSDIDFFKSVNDTYGHQAGDAVLREITKRFSSVCRKSESFGRYGGEEFIFILYPCRGDEALKACERIREAVTVEPFTINAETQQKLKVTSSFGAASMECFPDANIEQLMHYADLALYQAKKAGRNCSKLYAVDSID